MLKCVIKRCQNNTLTAQKKDGVIYHRFPIDEIIRENWRVLVARERFEEFYKPNKSSVICSNHFLESDIYYTTKGLRRIVTKANEPVLNIKQRHLLQKTVPATYNAIYN
ncbi:hypothetical protein ABMA27_007204 [Loxostege sticticalis]|uniref:THAP-type domain-containing protein n=1 Tax=Loxostege sticticalis TaxID=481309 RepID=A0ABR3HEK6_LOXSC